MNKYLPYINFVILILIIGFLSWFVFLKKSEVLPLSTNDIQVVDKCGDDCKKEIEKVVSDSIATLSGSTDTKIVEKETVKTIQVTPVPEASSKQTVYLPIGGPVGTTSTDWYNVPGTEFYLDYARDYGTDAYANWDAYLKVTDGNGAAYARLYDSTNKVAVNGSEVLVSGSGDLKQVSSGQLNFWQGRNLYLVQIKSLNGYEATFGNGRVKIIY